MSWSASKASAPGTWLADLCAHEGLPVVRGHARSRKAIPGGTATHDRSDAPQIAVRRRGGLLPPADVEPAEMRATRALLRRRMPLRRPRAGPLAHLHQTNSQYHRPHIGQKRADKANRGGVAERCSAPAVQHSIAVDRTRIGSYARLLTARELESGNTAQAPDAQTCYRRRSSPGVGNLLALVRRDERHARPRFPRGQAWGSSSRLVQCAPASAGTRHGPAGAKLGHASRTGAFSEAAVLGWRHQPAGPQYRARLATTQGTGHALTVLAQQLARAVSGLLRRATASELDTFFSEAGRGTREPDASLAAAGVSLRNVLWQG